MPKIRDLGINFIPATMRPPEIGPGGGLHAPPGAEHGPAYFGGCGPSGRTQECGTCTHVTCGFPSHPVADECTTCTHVTCGPSSRDDYGEGGPPTECTTCTHVTCGASSRYDYEKDDLPTECTTCTHVTCGASSRDEYEYGDHPVECTTCTHVTCGHPSHPDDNPDDGDCGTCTHVTCGASGDCEPYSAGPDKPAGGGGYKAGALTRDMIAQLKQQLQSHIGRELEN